MSSPFPDQHASSGCRARVASGTVGTHEQAEVAELADAGDSKSPGPCALEGSSPSFGTMKTGSYTNEGKPKAAGLLVLPQE